MIWCHMMTAKAGKPLPNHYTIPNINQISVHH